jgi:predicted PurR-regulated permease PerM
MDELLFLISEEGLPTFLVVIFLLGIGIVARWIATQYIHRLDNQFREMLREIAEMQTAILEHNNKVYSIVEKLISNQREIQEDINAIESSLETLLAFIKLNKNGDK